MSVCISSVIGQTDCMVAALSFSVLWLILCIFWALNSYAWYYLLITNILPVLSLKSLVWVIQTRFWSSSQRQKACSSQYGFSYMISYQICVCYKMGLNSLLNERLMSSDQHQCQKHWNSLRNTVMMLFLSQIKANTTVRNALGRIITFNDATITILGSW